MPSTAGDIIDCANLSTIQCIGLAWAWRTSRHLSDSSYLWTQLLALFYMPPHITGIRLQTYISTSVESRSTRNWVQVLSIYSPCCMLTPLSPTTTGNFLLNNYKQAIQIIKDYSLGICAWKQCLGISNQDIDGWLEDERKFLESLKEEPEECVLACAYVEALQTCQAAK